MSNEKPWDVPGKWRVSPFNYVPEVVREFDFTEPVIVEDSTIRKIEVTAGTMAPFPVEGKVEIAAALDELGIAMVGCNPTHYHGTAVNRSITEGVRAIAKRGFKFKLEGGQVGVWKESRRELEDRADRLVEIGINIMTIHLPGSLTGLRTLGNDVTLAQVVDKALPLMEYAKKRGLESGPRFGDATRGDLEELLPAINTFIDHGADIFGIADSSGSISPQAAQYFLRRLKAGLKKRVPFICHVHDSFGMATAVATIVGLEGGIPEVTVNGMADKPFADLAEVALSFEVLYGASTGLRLERLTETSRIVERVTGVPVQPLRPVTGSALYIPWSVPSTALGDGASEFIRLLNGEPTAYPFSALAPGVVGSAPRLVWHQDVVRRDVIRAKLVLMYLPHSDDDVARTLVAIDARLRALEEAPMWLEDGEVEEICRGVFADRPD